MKFHSQLDCGLFFRLKRFLVVFYQKIKNLNHTILYYSIQCDFTQFDFIRYNSIYHSIRNPFNFKYNLILYSSIQFNSIQFYAIQFNPIDYNILYDHNSIQFNSIFYTIQFGMISFN